MALNFKHSRLFQENFLSCPGSSISVAMYVDHLKKLVDDLRPSGTGFKDKKDPLYNLKDLVPGTENLQKSQMIRTLTLAMALKALPV